MINKSILKSKTFWVQVATVATVLFPAVQAWLAANPVEFVAALAAVNVLVRFVTSGRITIFEEAGQVRGLCWLPLAVGTAVAVGTLLPACHSAGLPLRASIRLEEGRLSYSSKGGLEMEYAPGYGQMPAGYRDGGGK